MKAAGTAALATSASVVLGGSAPAAQQGAPAIRTNTQAGRRIRSFIKFDREIPSMQPVTLRALTGRMVAIRTEAAQTCYSSVGQVLMPSANAPQNIGVVGHGGVGIVEAIGPEVFAVQVGDRVVVNFHAACGWCYNCVKSRSDQCVNQGGGSQQIPAGDTADGRPVFSGTSGMTEVMIVNQEKCVPVFTDVSSVELSMLTCVGNAGLGLATTKCPVEIGSDVVVFGCGPVGLSAIQGARIKGAARIIAVEPIRYRRDLALKLGATDGVDPNQYTARSPIPGGAGISGDMFKDALVDHLREMCKGKTDRSFAGGGRVGPDHVIEAVGGDYGGVKPSEVSGPDPTGLTVLSQIWQLCSSTGTSVSCSIGYPAGSVVQISATNWADGAKHFWGGTCGGTNARRDVPRYVRLMEAGKLDMKSLAARTFPLAQTTEAYRVAMNRTVVATVVTPNA
ncbi:MAG: alcohol dehydrogenase catalytic domain-containing protein [Vicinamibacterales bacterium]